MQASLDLQWVREIEYDTELATGSLPPTGRVLRLRSTSQTFEFVIPSDVVARWYMMLPPRRLTTPAVGGPPPRPTRPPPPVVGPPRTPTATRTPTEARGSRCQA